MGRSSSGSSVDSNRILPDDGSQGRSGRASRVSDDAGVEDTGLGMGRTAEGCLIHTPSSSSIPRHIAIEILGPGIIGTANRYVVKPGDQPPRFDVLGQRGSLQISQRELCYGLA